MSNPKKPSIQIFQLFSLQNSDTVIPFLHAKHSFVIAWQQVTRFAKNFWLSDTEPHHWNFQSPISGLSDVCQIPLEYGRPFDTDGQSSNSSPCVIKDGIKINSVIAICQHCCWELVVLGDLVYLVIIDYLLMHIYETKSTRSCTLSYLGYKRR